MSSRLRQQCHICGKTLSGDLSRHLLIHGEEKQHKCPEPGCKYATHQASNLKSHMNKHTGKRPLNCMICTSTFADAGSRSRHEWRIHEFRRQDQKHAERDSLKASKSKAARTSRVPYSRKRPTSASTSSSSSATGTPAPPYPASLVPDYSAFVPFDFEAMNQFLDEVDPQYHFAQSSSAKTKHFQYAEPATPQQSPASFAAVPQIAVHSNEFIYSSTASSSWSPPPVTPPPAYSYTPPANVDSPLDNFIPEFEAVWNDQQSPQVSAHNTLFTTPPDFDGRSPSQASPIELPVVSWGPLFELDLAAFPSASADFIGNSFVQNF